MKDTLKFNLDSAEGVLSIEEEIEQLDPSTEEGKFDIEAFRVQVKMVSKMIVVKGLLQAANLQKYETFALKQILKNDLGPKQNTIITLPKKRNVS